MTETLVLCSRETHKTVETIDENLDDFLVCLVSYTSNHRVD